MRAEDPLVDVAHQRLVLIARGLPAGALDRGHAPDERPDLRVAELGLGRHRLQQPVLRLAHELLVEVAAAPGVAVGELPRRLPGGEHVELRVAVQVDQPGQDHAVGLGDGNPVGLRLRDGLDRAPPADHDVGVLDRPLGGQHAAPERE